MGKQHPPAQNRTTPFKGCADVRVCGTPPPGNGGDESTEALALTLANQAGLDAGKMMAGDLDDEGWTRLATAAAELGVRYPDDKARLATMMEAIDKAGAARGAP